MKALIRILLFAISLATYHVSCAQLGRISKIDVYGNRSIGSDIILSQLKMKEGDNINPAAFTPDTIISSLKTIPGIKYVSVDLLCCDSEKGYVLYIGVAESDSFVLKYRPAPKQMVQLSDKVITAYKNFSQHAKAATQKGMYSEEYINGYSLLSYPDARKEQLSFITLANEKMNEIEYVLKHSRYAEQREAAAQIIAYSTNKKKVVESLLHAINDEDENVRNNATRALSILVGYLSEHPEIMVTIPTVPFIKMLNSVTWTDRNKGAMVLAQLTQNRDPDLLAQIKKEALPSLIEMAKWKNREHAFFSFLILGRICGENEDLLIERNFSTQWKDNVEGMVEICSLE
jgi:hypothetical protein